MHEPHSSGVRRITHFVRVEVVMQKSDKYYPTPPPQIFDAETF